MVIYACGPIDWWYGWTPLEQVLEKAMSRPGFPDFPLRAADIHERLQQARRFCPFKDSELRQGEGGPWFCPLPLDDPGNYEFLLAWKLDNNGTTYVVSPFQLPWLDQCQI